MGRGPRCTLDELSPAARAEALAQMKPYPRAAFNEQEPNIPPAKLRIRQKSGPALNKTETAFVAHLREHYPDARIEPHAIALRIANGCVYWPDVLLTGIAGEPKVWEVKGGHLWDDAIVKLKVAARAFPWLEFWLASPVDRTLRAWNCQRVFP